MNDERRLDWAGRPINPEMGEGRWQDALRRMRARIAEGNPFEADDCTAPGQKDTFCTWGMCSNEREQWPDKDDHIWPVLFEREGRVAPRRTPEDGTCPFDKRGEVERQRSGYRYGCFFHCMIFKGREGVYLQESPITREGALACFDEHIQDREGRKGALTAKNDSEPWRKG